MNSVELAGDIAETYDASWEITRGGMNVVATTAQNVIKVPVDESEWRLQALAREYDVLRLFDGADFSPFAVPRLVDYSDDPTYLVTTYVPGKSAAAKEIRNWSKPEREYLGHSLGEYILGQINTISGDTAEGLAILPTRDRTAEFENVGSFADPDHYPTLTSVCSSLYDRWQDYNLGSAEYGIHGDLTPHNIILSEERRLTGVIDFARAHVGSIAEELSTVCDVDISLLEACVDELQQGGIETAVEHALVWRDMKYIHVGPTLILSGQLDYQNCAAFRDSVTSLYPNLDWQELYTMWPTK
jgi:aminoglycoside phosphotransferase (APT) family kinase protein